MDLKCWLWWIIMSCVVRELGYFRFIKGNVGDKVRGKYGLEKSYGPV